MRLRNASQPALIVAYEIRGNALGNFFEWFHGYEGITAALGRR